MKSQKIGLNKGLAATGAVAAAMMLVSMIAWPRIPADGKIPTHWGLGPEPDGYGTRLEALVFIPVTAVILLIVQWLLPKIEPRKQHLELSARTYSVVWVTIMLFLAALHCCIVAGGFGYKLPMPLIICGLLGIVFVILGNYMGKIRSNYFLGFRYPWTLSSELAWNKTHRLGGWGFVIVGMLTLLIVLATQNSLISLIVMTSGLIIVSIGTMVYSYVVWKNDPARAGNGGSM